jgi:hypothetical protein
MTSNDLEHRKGDFSGNFRDFKPLRAFHWRIAPKRLEIDDNKLHMKFLSLNADFNDVSADLVAPRVTE